MKIRNAQFEDLEQIKEVYKQARHYMIENGNSSQWGTSYPPEDIIGEDIRKKQLFAGTDDTGKIHFVFAFVIGEDPTYRLIEQGCWMNEAPYGTIHRAGSDGMLKGCFAECLSFCQSRISNLRADTHRDNLTMQHLLEKFDFRKCGIIHVKDGSERIAYQRNLL